jgi:long-chain acyl-CoA synthetase
VLVHEFLEQSAAGTPSRTAVVADGRRYSYRDIDRAATRLACAFRAGGVHRGDRVAVHLDNGVELLVSIFAALKASAVFVPLSPQLRLEKLAYVLNDARASALVTTARWASLASAPGPLAHVRLVVVTDADRSDVAAPPAAYAGDAAAVVSYAAVVAAGGEDIAPPLPQNIDIDLAALIYTSGSTGLPKGVMLTHLNIVSAATSIVSYLGNTSDDVILNGLPMSFGYGLYQALTAFQVGATLVVERSFAFPHAVLASLEREHATGVALVPSIVSTLVRMDLGRYALSSLRYVTSAAAPLPPDRIRQLRQALPHVQIFSMYGLTECQRVSYLPPDEIDARPDSVGRGMPNSEAYVIDDEGQRAGPGMVGELVVRGAHVMKGYWQLPSETARRLRPDPRTNEPVLHTGDLFRMDEDGYLYFVARVDDVIKTGGEKVCPREVENVLYRLDDVDEAAVVGVPHPVLGHAVKAIVAVRPGAHLTAMEVRRHCARHLETFMVPASVEFVAALPHTASRKIDRRALQDLGRGQ